MLLPLGDSPNPKGVPFVTYAIIALNVAVYVLVTLPLSTQAPDPQDPALREYVQAIAPSLPPETSVGELLEQTSRYDLTVFAHGFRPSDPSLVSLFTSMFMHGGFMHLFGNMLFLWIYGDNVEKRLGTLAYLFWYLATGAAATMFHALFAGGSPIPLVGASGAISGVLGLYFVWFPHNQVRLWVFLFPFFMNVIQLSARIVLGMYLLVDNVLPYLFSSGGGGGVAHGAHIGGFIAGLLVALLSGRRESSAVPGEYREARRETAPSTPSEQIAQALVEGQPEQAARWYFSLPPAQARGLLDASTSLALGGWLGEHGHSHGALTVYQRHLRDFPNGPGRAEAHLGAGLVQLHGLGQPVAAYQHLMDALQSSPSPEIAARAREALNQIAAMQKRQVPWQR